MRSGWTSAAAGARRLTPLHIAAQGGDADVMAALLGAGADTSITDSRRYAVYAVHTDANT